MTILMLLDSEFPPDVRVNSEATTLIKNGHNVYILSYNFGNKINYEITNGIKIHRFKIWQQLAKKMLGFIHIIPIYHYIWLYQVKKAIAKIKPNAIHIHDLPLCTLIKPIKQKYKVHIVADMHENYPYLVAMQPHMNSNLGKLIFSTKIWFKKEKEWLTHADEIICVASEMGNRIKNVLDVEKNIVTVPNTLNFDEFFSKQTNVNGLVERFKETFNILYVGGIDPVRGIDCLIKAGATLKLTGLCFKIIIVGDGNMFAELKSLSEKLGLENEVIFEGFKPANQLKAYVDISDVCIIPHLRSEQTDNSSPNKLFQYMVFKKPVISSNCKSIVQIIEIENCGLIFEDRNHADLAEKILFLKNNKLTADKMGECGYNAVMNKYNWENTSVGLIDIYNKK